MILKFLYSPEVRSYLLDLKVRAFLRKHRGRQVSKNKGQIGKINQMSKKSKNASNKEQVTKKKKKKKLATRRTDTGMQEIPCGMWAGWTFLVWTWSGQQMLQARHQKAIRDYLVNTVRHFCSYCLEQLIAAEQLAGIFLRTPVKTVDFRDPLHRCE